MADIKNMQPDSLPLISANTLKAAAAAQGKAGSESSAQRSFEGEVVKSEAEKSGWTLTLKVDGKSLQVKSELPLPQETRVQLALTEQQGKPQLQVKNIQLPAAEIPEDAVNDDAVNDAANKAAVKESTAAVIKPVLQQFLASRLPMLPAASATHGTSEAGPAGLYSPKPAAAMTVTPSQITSAQPSALHQLLPLLAAANTSPSQQLVQPQTQQASPQTASPVPQEVGKVLEQWLQQLPDSQQMSRPDGVSRQIRNSGLSYENQLLRLSEKIRSGLTAAADRPAAGKANPSAGSLPAVSSAQSPGAQSPTAQPSTAQSSTTQSSTTQSATQTGVTETGTQPRNELAGIFRGLWLKAARTMAEPAAPGSDQTTRSGLSQHAAQPGSAQPTAVEPNTGKPAATAAALLNQVQLQPLKTTNQAAAQTTHQALNTGVTQNPAPAVTPAPAQAFKAALEQTRARLESALSPQEASAKPAASAAEQQLQQQLQQLLGSDHKAVLARALLQWLNHLRPEGTPQLRELPVSQPQLQDPPEAFRLLQTALAQTESEQAARLQSSDSNLLNIPLFFRQGEQLREIQLQIKHEEQNAADKTGKKSLRWQLRLHFDLQQLGPMDVEINLALPTLSATFWSETQSTLHLLNHKLTPLRKKLADLGVEVSELQARYGQLPPMQRNQVRQFLVDTHG